MPTQQLVAQLKNLNEHLRNEGFVIDGIFGSHARQESTSSSDLDLLYHLEDAFYRQNSGFIGFKKLEELKTYLANELHMRVDLAPTNNLSKTAQKYILRDVVYV